MDLTEQDKKHIITLLMSEYQMFRINFMRDKKLLKDIQNNTCTQQQWQELYFRFLKEK